MSRSIQLLHHFQSLIRLAECSSGRFRKFLQKNKSIPNKSTPVNMSEKMKRRLPKGFVDDEGIVACCGVVRGAFAGG